MCVPKLLNIKHIAIAVNFKIIITKVASIQKIIIQFEENRRLVKYSCLIGGGGDKGSDVTHGERHIRRIRANGVCRVNNKIMFKMR